MGGKVTKSGESLRRMSENNQRPFLLESTVREASGKYKISAKTLTQLNHIIVSYNILQ